MAISNAKIFIYFSNKISGSNFIEQPSEIVMVSNYQNADCSLKNYDFQHTFVPYGRLTWWTRTRYIDNNRLRSYALHGMQVNKFTKILSTVALPCSLREPRCYTGLQVKCAYPTRTGGVLISLSWAVSPQVDKPLLSVTHGQCDGRSTVTFPAAGHHRLLTGTKLYCLVTEARVWTTCPRLLPESARVGVERPNHNAT